MTDRYTDDLFIPPTRSLGGSAFVSRLSRLVFDPERFEDDAIEPMASLGMGAVYTSTSSLGRLRGADFSPEAREEVLDKLFRPYAASLEHTVSTVLETLGRCLIIDAHSFPSIPLPYEDGGLARPDLCIGFDSYHAPEILVHAVEQKAIAHGWSTARNEPFAGSYVPIRHYRKERRVTSLMLEINRRLYMDEATGDKSDGFEQTASVVSELVATAVSFEAFRHTDFIVTAAEHQIIIRIGDESPALDRVLAANDVLEWAFVTAYNPDGRAVSADANRRADDDLIKELRERNFRSYPGFGRSDIGDWPPEPSHLVLGILRDDAIDLARRFSQAAIVVGRRGAPAELITPK